MSATATKTPQEKAGNKQSTSDFERNAKERAKMVHDWKTSMDVVQSYESSFERVQRWAKEEKWKISDEVSNKLSGMLKAIKENPALGEDERMELEWRKTVNIECMSMQRYLYNNDEFKYFTETVLKAESPQEMTKLDKEWLLWVVTKHGSTMVVNDEERAYFEYFAKNLREKGVAYLDDEEILSYMFEIVNEGGLERMVQVQNKGAAGQSSSKSKNIGNTLRG